MKDGCRWWWWWGGFLLFTSADRPRCQLHSQWWVRRRASRKCMTNRRLWHLNERVDLKVREGTGCDISFGNLDACRHFLRAWWFCSGTASPKHLTLLCKVNEGLFCSVFCSVFICYNTSWLLSLSFEAAHRLLVRVLWIVFFLKNKKYQHANNHCHTQRETRPVRLVSDWATGFYSDNPKDVEFNTRSFLHLVLYWVAFS